MLLQNIDPGKVPCEQRHCKMPAKLATGCPTPGDWNWRNETERKPQIIVFKNFGNGFFQTGVPSKLYALPTKTKFYPESILNVCKSTICPCLYYCCPIWSGAPANDLELLYKTQKRTSNIIGLDVESQLQSLPHHRKVDLLYLFHKYIHGNCFWWVLLYGA